MEQYYERCSSGNSNYVEDLFKYFFLMRVSPTVSLVSDITFSVMRFIECLPIAFSYIYHHFVLHLSGR